MTTVSEPRGPMSNEQRTVSWAGKPPSAIPALEGAPESGRYLIEGQLGAGGMGVVYTAHDRELHRRVALKVLRPESQSEAGGARLQREAQAMASLHHPNVVTVYDVGRLEGGQVFVAMELVDGSSLRKWLDERERPVQEVLGAFIEAGRGLAAAHAAGLVHRDFKPDNVLVAASGAVRVADFGVARRLEEEGTPRAGGSPGATPDSLALPMTRTGALLGTPVYMAPEQLRGEPAGAQSDQFSFCVALYEALAGQRPFEGASPTALLEAIGRGTPAPPQRSRLPRWLLPVLARGMRLEPAQRWPSMDALLAELRRDAWRKRRSWLFAAAALALVGLLIVAGKAAQRRQSLLCKGGERKLRNVWDDARRAKVQAAFTANGPSFGVRAATQAVLDLDGYAASIVAAHEDACEATQLRGEQSPLVLDLRMRCLDDRLRALSAVGELFENADTRLIGRAPLVVRGLPSVTSCADVAALQAPTPAPQLQLERVTQVKERLAKALAVRLGGKAKDALPITRAAVKDAQEIGWPPLVAETTQELGAETEDAGDPRAAQAIFQEALVLAQAGRDEARLVRSALSLATNLSRLQDKLPEGRFFAQLAQSTMDRLHDESLSFRVEQVLGLLAFAEGKYEEARGHYQRALQLGAKVFGKDAAAIADINNSLGGVEGAEGHYQEASTWYRNALESYERSYGDDHPSVAMVLGNLAGISFGHGRYAEAEASYRRAAALTEKQTGAKSMRVVGQLRGLGFALLALHRDAEAEALFRSARATAVGMVGPKHAEVAELQAGTGAALLAQGKPAAARAELEQALEVKTAVLGKDHPSLAEVLRYLAEADIAEGKLDAARARYRESLELAQKAFGKDHPSIAESLAGLAQVSLLQKRPEEARGFAVQADEMFQRALGKDHPDAIHAHELRVRAEAVR